MVIIINSLILINYFLVMVGVLNLVVINYLFYSVLTLL